MYDWMKFAMAMVDKNERFQKILREENFDELFKFCQDKIKYDPIESTMFIWGYTDKKYTNIQSYLIKNKGF